MSHSELIAHAAAQIVAARSRSSLGTLASSERPSIPILPGYHLIREVHRGGQGVVYQAVQLATQRHVAVKVLRDGAMAGPSERARFDREVQLLAQLDHPNIVGILDRGMAGSSPFLVMEYIRGQALDAYLAATRADARRTVGLLRKIAVAVGAAHVRGIIHRDLKPGNIRVDEQGEPHVLDFGLARSLWEPAADDSINAATLVGQFVGSTAWASPEQARGGGPGPDTRSDVYSLGVLAYQSLTGRFPYSVDGPARDVLDRIVGADPIRPSTFSSRVDDELETIVLKCLSKEPERRYQSAGELAADLGRYLAGEPIDAKRDSATYLLRKQLRRHRALVAFAACIAVLLIAGSMTSLTLWRTAERHREEAVKHLELATAARAEADRQAVAAKEESARAKRVVDLLGAVFHQADPKFGGDRTLPASEMLKGGAERVLSLLKDDPRVTSEFLRALGEIHMGLGDWDRARDLLTRSMDLIRAQPEPDNDAITFTANRLGTLEQQVGNLTKAEEHLRLAYELTRSRLGPRNWHSLEALIVLLMAERKYPAAEQLLREGLSRMGEFYPATSVDAPMPSGELMLRITWSNHLAGIMESDGRYAEASLVMREASRLADSAPVYLVDMVWAVRNNLAWLLANTGEYVEAQTLAQQVFEQRKQKLPGDHPDLASSMIVLGTAKMRGGDRSEAELLLREGLGIREAKFAPDDDRIAQARLLLDECVSGSVRNHATPK